MSGITFDSISVGDVLPEHICGPITRTTLGLFAGASGDHNPIHIDIDFAKKFGMKDVFAHGMLSMAYLAQLLTNYLPQSQLREYGVRFVAITPVNTRVSCSGKITEKYEVDGEKLIKVEITAEVDGGIATLTGDAIFAIA